MKYEDFINNIKKDLNKDDLKRMEDTKEFPAYVILENVSERLWLSFLEYDSINNLIIAKCLEDSKVIKELTKDSIVGAKYNEEGNNIVIINKLSKRTFKIPVRGVIKEIETLYDEHRTIAEKYDKLQKEATDDLLDDLANMLKAYDLNEDDFNSIFNNMKNNNDVFMLMDYLINSDINDVIDIQRQTLCINGFPIRHDKIDDGDKSYGTIHEYYVDGTNKDLDLSLDNLHLLSGQKAKVLFKDGTTKIGFMGSDFINNNKKPIIGLYEAYDKKKGFNDYNIYLLEDIDEITAVVRNPLKWYNNIDLEFELPSKK